MTRKIVSFLINSTHFKRMKTGWIFIIFYIDHIFANPEFKSQIITEILCFEFKNNHVFNWLVFLHFFTSTFKNKIRKKIFV